MGHLINPAGFRVGYFSNWSDLWSTSNNLVYAELLHNTIYFRKVMALFFQNFVTDRYSIMYSHFTVEVCGLTKLSLKLYFYDGIVEQKLAHLLQQLAKFRKQKLRTHKRILRRFWKIKPVKILRSRLLSLWRYYEYLTARQIIFFFIYFLYMGISSLSPDSFFDLLRYYFIVLAAEWSALIKRNYTISIFSFVKYYVKMLVFKGFNPESVGSGRLHVKGAVADFSIFFKALDESINFWRKQQNFFSLLISKNKVNHKSLYARFLNPVKAASNFANFFFVSFFRTYLLSFRQPKFFKFVNFTLSKIFKFLGILETTVDFFGIDNDSISAAFLARYIARKIEMRFQIKELFTPIGREMRHLMRNTSALFGYKLQFVGRLTRRGRVRTTWKLGGSVPTSRVSAQVEHSLYVGILRNGVCCVRVWLYRHKSYGNYNKNFLYRVKT